MVSTSTGPWQQRGPDSPLWVGEDKPIENPREVSEVEDVVELGRGGRQVLDDVFVQHQGAGRQQATHGCDALMERLQEEDAPARHQPTSG